MRFMMKNQRQSFKSVEKIAAVFFGEIIGTH